jgi:hypothetical protein
VWRNALFATGSILLASFLGLMTQLDCLLPYKRLLADRYLVPAAIYTALFATNVFAVFFVLTRFLLLKDTGRKLQHALRGATMWKIAR